jgi:hypothetical protein
VAGDDDLARAQRTGAKRNEVKRERSAREPGQFVERDRRSRTRDGHKGPRSPATGRAAFVITAGAAGLTVLRKGSKPVRVETPGSNCNSPGGSMRSPRARPRGAGTRPAGTRARQEAKIDPNASFGWWSSALFSSTNALATRAYLMKAPSTANV